MADFPRRWGAYVLMRPLGSGGMGSVFLALTRVRGEDTVCVIKRLTTETLSDEGRRKRFQREAEISRTLSNGGIAKTIDTGEHEGEPYIAQEYIEGRTVAQLCLAAEGVGERLSPVMVAQIGQRLASALAYAHRRDVVHRDIAPSNVMISFEGAVSLIDFGIARRSSDPSLTATGEFIGRATYTAPEVLAGGEADARSDIYALGVLLWELLVGMPPTLGQLESHPAPPSALTDAAIPAELDRLIVRALDPDPGRRFHCAEDFAAGLLQIAPRGADRSHEIATLIGKCYEVAREHERLEADIDEARVLLPSGGESNRRHLAKVHRLPQPWRWLWLLGGAAALSAMVALVLRARKEVHDLPAEARAESPPVAPATAPTPAPAAPEAPAQPTAPAPVPAPTKVSHPKPVLAAARRQPASHTTAVPSAAGRLLDQARDSLDVGDFDDATRNAEEALETGTARQQSAAHLVLGRVLLMRGKRMQAAEEFSEAVQLDPENAAASDHLASLRRQGVD